MILRGISMLHAMRHFFSRSTWALRLLGVKCDSDHKSERGLILIQMDGVGHGQLKRALESGRMSFLSSLLDGEDYCLRSFYSGLPSTTPAVQGEIFYGRPGAVPAFGFSRDGRLTSMLDGETAQAIQDNLTDAGAPLLDGGTAYSNIYDGGAENAGFCVTRLGATGLFPRAGWWSRVCVILLYIFMLVRAGALMILEFLLALWDLARGVKRGHSPLHELAFVPKRVSVGILLRELVTLGASLDASRGVPVIHCNFLGYDEQAHRRGPDSRFAHWTLKGIDGAIRRIARAAQNSRCRDYDLWVYSDHGQADSVAYEQLHKRSLQAAVDEVFACAGVNGMAVRQVHESEAEHRSRLLGGALLQRLFEWPKSGSRQARIPVSAMGPVGHVYSPRELNESESLQLAEDLVVDAHVPAVLTVEGEGHVCLLVNRNAHAVRERICDVYATGNNRLDAWIEEDLTRLVRHPDAGDFVLLGACPDGRTVTFSYERGSHGGPGRDEMDAFVLAPMDAPFDALPHEPLRPVGLRRAAMRFLGKIPRSSRVATRPCQNGLIRLMTYNTHACIGLDGRHSPERIARVIARHRPDIVALQELDANRSRTEYRQQAAEIADSLGMSLHFCPALVVNDEAYGNAILSSWPMRVIRSGSLPGPSGCEPRGALWVAVDLPEADGRLHVINTHLGLRPAERLRQVEALMSRHWLGHPECQGPRVLCGDFNALPRSRGYAGLTSRLQDAYRISSNPGYGRTWLGVGRIDHIFLSHSLHAHRVFAPRTSLSRIGSDHLPLVADISLS